MAIARRGEKADSMAAAVAPVAVRRNSRRFHEIAFSRRREDPKSPARKSPENFSRLRSFCVSKGSIRLSSSRRLVPCLYGLLCLGSFCAVVYFFRFCILLFQLLEYSQVLVGQLLVIRAVVQEHKAIMRAIEIGAEPYGLFELLNSLRVFQLVLIVDAELIMSLI